MSLRNRLVLPVILSALAVLAACGGSSSPVITPPPSGGFTNSNLNGTYVFSATGSDTTNGFFWTIVGTFTADGNGGIKSGGVLDTNSNTFGPVTKQAITGGSYGVGADGRPASGRALLSLTTATTTYAFDFVLTSKEHGLITEFDGNATGSGTLDLQANVTQTNIDGQSYAFNLTGTSGTGNVFCTLSGNTGTIPFATVGAFTLGASGSISTGVEDFNNNCSSSGLTDLPFTGGSVNIASVPGVATLSTTAGTFTFDVYPVDPTHLKFIETDATTALSGDAFTQTSSIPAANVLVAAGFDPTAGLPFALAGILSTDGSGNIASSSTEDINEGGTATQVTSGITGTYSTLTGGRSLLTFTSGFYNGNNGVACTGCVFAAYPSSGGLQLLEIDNAGMTDGSAFLQGSSPVLASGQGFGLNLSGSSSTGTEEDDIAEFTNNNGTLGPGVIDINQGGSTMFDNKYSASYAADSSVAGRGVITPVTNGYSLVTYGYGTSNQVVVSVDPNLVAVGFAVEQNASAKSNAAISHMAMLRLGPGAHKALKKRSGR